MTGTKALMKLLEEQKAGRRPTPAENASLKKVAAEFSAKVDKALRQARVQAKAVVGGSGAKGTWLRGVHDIDVFICFDYKKYKEKTAELSEFVAAALKKTFPKHERLHGSRDYFRVESSGYNFELVPILRIARASQALNITDVSLLHSAWVQQQIRKKKHDLADEIRLTKAFAKAQRVYGAESYVRGFSGYACEILTIHHGSFLALLKAATTVWQRHIAVNKKIIVDAAQHYKRRDALRDLNGAKIQSELIVIDPVQHDRNATAALSTETLLTFIAAAAAFLKRSAPGFFERQAITEETLREKAQRKALTLVDAVPMRGKEDVVGAKLVKAHGHLRDLLTKHGFVLADSGWEWQRGKNALFWYMTDTAAPAAEIRYGPPLNNALHAEKFRKEHGAHAERQVFEKDGRLYARIPRAYDTATKLIAAAVQEDYLKDKAQRYSVKG